MVGVSAQPDHTVEVVEYSSDWPRAFETERVALEGAVGELAVSIEHIGSTAVVGMSAKPTIDILLVVSSIRAFLLEVPSIEALGYEHKGATFADRPDHHFLRKVVDGKRTHHLHVVPDSSPEVADYRLLRDALRSDPHLAGRYQEIKRTLADRYGNDRMRYVIAKEAWVEHEIAVLRSPHPAG